MTQGAATSYLGNVLQGVAGILAFSASCGLCAAFGLVQSGDISKPANWPLWVGALVVFGAAGTVGGAANAARQIWKKRKIGRAPGDRLTVVDLAGDNEHKKHKEDIRESLDRFFGPTIHTLDYPETFRLDEGLTESRLSKTASKAQRALAAKRGDILIWGRVKSDKLLSLRFTIRSSDTTGAKPYLLTEEHELPAHFENQLGAVLASRVVSVASSLLGRTGHFLSPYAARFASQLRPIVERPNASWSPDSRGAVWNAYGIAIAIVGEESGEPHTLEEAVAAHRAALEEWTRGRVPLQWAMAQMNLGAALLALGERESGTARLEEAVAAHRAALEERTHERAPLQWATTQNNLGGALQTPGQRESGTARLAEAVAAYRSALEEWTRERAPLDWAIATGNMGFAMVRLAERTGDPAAAEAALAQIETAHATMQAASHGPYAAYYESALPHARALVDRLRGGAAPVVGEA